MNEDGDLTKIFMQTNDGQKHTIDQIDDRDAKGNWTRKTLSEWNMTTQRGEPVMIVYRAITYYEEGLPPISTFQHAVR